MTEKINYFKNKWGFYQASPLPSEEELRDYYSQHYYQTDQPRGYSTKYDSANLKHKETCAERIALTIEKYASRGGARSFLDIGCGEGFMLNTMLKFHYQVKGIDFSSFAIEHHNPHLTQFFSEGDIFTGIRNLYENKELFDVIFIGNVIEHVISPENLLIGIEKILQPNGVLIIIAPNDFTELQNHLIETGYVKNSWWLGYPDHLSYFNYDSMRNFLAEFNFEIKICLGDFPIELALFSDVTNYVKNRSIGKEVHQLRVNIDNYLFDKDPQKLIEMSILFGGLRMGRNLIYFCERKKP